MATQPTDKLSIVSISARTGKRKKRSIPVLAEAKLRLVLKNEAGYGEYLTVSGETGRRLVR